MLAKCLTHRLWLASCAARIARLACSTRGLGHALADRSSLASLAILNRGDGFQPSSPASSVIQSRVGRRLYTRRDYFYLNCQAPA